MRSANRKKITGLALMAAVVVMAAALAYASGGEHHGAEHHSSVTPEKLKDLAWRTMNFAALLVILVKFLGKPIGNALSSRRMSIMTRFEELEERRSEVENTYKQYEEKLGHIDQEVQSIIDAAKAQGEAEKAKILGEATRGAEDIKRKAALSVQNELSVAKQQLRTEVAEQAAAMAEELIRKNFTEADQATLVDSYLEKVGGLK